MTLNMLQARIHTGFHRFMKIGQSCNKEINFSWKKTFQIKIWPISWLNDSENQER